MKNLRKKLSFKHSLLAIGAITGMTVSMSTATIQIIESQNYVYLFDDWYYDSPETLNSMVNIFTNESVISFNQNQYLYDNQLFNTKGELNRYLDSQFKIDELTTKRNPLEYLKTNNGELSNLVTTDDTDQIITVYRQKNGTATLSKTEAINSYVRYTKEYDIDGNIFDSEQNARYYLTNTFKENLNSSDEKKEVFLEAGIARNEQEIKDWLRKTSKKGFEYNGHLFSDYNREEFDNYFASVIDADIIKNNVQEVHNADKKTYWINYDKSKNKIGSELIGPKYVETVVDIPTVPTFERTEDFSVNAVLSPSIIGSIVDANLTYKSTNFDAGKDMNKDLNDFLQSLKNEEILDEEVYNNFYNKFYLPFTGIIRDATTYTEGLDQIQDKEITNFHKMLIALKRFLTSTKVYDTTSFGDDFALEADKDAKNLILSLLKNTSNESMLGLTGDGFDFSSFESNDYTFNDIYDLFLNPASFSKIDGGNSSKWDILKKVQNAADTIIGGLDGMAEVNDSLSEKVNKEVNKNKDKDSTTVATTFLEETTKKVVDKITNILPELAGKLHLEKLIGVAGAFNPLVKALSTAWELGQSLSFMSIVTSEYKIDENQSLFFTTQVYKIPLFGTELTTDQPKGLVVTKITDSLLSFLVPKDDEGNIRKVYQVNGRYYTDYETAVSVFKELMYIYPERFLPCKKIFTTVMNKNEEHILPSEIINAIITDKPSAENPNEMTQIQYDGLLKKELDDFVDSLFDKHYRPSLKEYYLDGFGNYFDNKEEAISSFNKNISQSEPPYQIRYAYTTRNGVKILRETEDEIIDFIRKNEVIDSKQILNKDLITTSYFDSLTENQNNNYQIYSVDYFGIKKYFINLLSAQNFVHNNTPFEHFVSNNSVSIFNYKGNKFYSQAAFNSWIEANTIKVRANKAHGHIFKGDEVINA